MVSVGGLVRSAPQTRTEAPPVAVNPRRGEASPTASLPDAVRAFGVMSGGPALLTLLAGGSLAAVAAGALSGRPQTAAARLLRPLIALGAAAPALYLLAVRPWFLRWGATPEEARAALPGDELVPDPAIEATRAITVDAPAEDVWPWLAQIGQDRGGFYSYAWLENLAGCRLRNADRIHPEWQRRDVGETLPLHPAAGLKVLRFEPGRALALEGGWAFALAPLDARTTRLYARSRVPRGPGALAYGLFVELPHFVMERAMLRGIKARAERAAEPNTLLDAVLPAYDFRGRTEAVIHAPPAAIFRALRTVTLADMPLAAALGALRYLPGRLTGRTRPRPDDRARPFFDLTGNLTLAVAPDRELVVGCAGRLHDPLDQQFVALDGPAAFARFDAPGHEKLAMSFRIAGGDARRGYRLACEHRTQALGAGARRAFAVYWWLLIRWSSAVMLRLLLAAVKRRAEGSAPPGAG